MYAIRSYYDQYPGQHIFCRGFFKYLQGNAGNLRGFAGFPLKKLVKHLQNRPGFGIPLFEKQVS